MDIKTIGSMGRRLKRFLQPFADCFCRSEPRHSLFAYVRGQLSNLERKSIEPMALDVGVRPRTLQFFLSSVPWDGERLRDRIQWSAAKNHAHPKAIGIIDETGSPKKGEHTCGVGRQWCGNTGKVDNCVVTVHLGYSVGDFQCLLDSDLYLQKDWVQDWARRKKAGIPDEVVFRTKPQIALGQIDRALNNGIRFWALTFDELYGRDGAFLDGLDRLGQSYVGEIPSDFVGWLRQPSIVEAAPAGEGNKKGRNRQYPRLSEKALPAHEVRDLVAHSEVFRRQTWRPYRIKEGEKGPVVWEVKVAPFYRKQGPQDLPLQEHTLIVARNVLDVSKVKYFLSNRSLGTSGWHLEDLLWVGFSRFPIERCFEVGKRELGMDHFEVRSWRGIHRHFYISQLSQLFCATVHQQLREKKDDGRSLPDGRAGSDGGQCLVDCSSAGALGSPCLVPARGR